MPKAVITFVCKVICKSLLQYYFTHVQSCDIVHVQCATEWTASVYTLHIAQSCDNVWFNVLQNGLLRYILYTLRKAVITFGSMCYGMDCFGTYFKHVQTCDNVRVQSASGHMLNFPDFAFSCFRVFVFSRFPVFAFSCFRVCVFSWDHRFSPPVFAFSRFRVLPAASPRPGHRFRVHSILGYPYFWKHPYSHKENG